MSEIREISEVLRKIDEDIAQEASMFAEEARLRPGVPLQFADSRLESETAADADAPEALRENARIKATGPGMAMRESGKLPYHLIPPEFSMVLAAVLQNGTEKYAARNYEKGLPLEDLLRGMEAHLLAIKAGEIYDRESDLPHAAHLAWAALTFSMQMLRSPELSELWKAAVLKTRSGALSAVGEQLREQYALGAESAPTATAMDWNTINAVFRAVLTENKLHKAD